MELVGTNNDEPSSTSKAIGSNMEEDEAFTPETVPSYRF